ncbi:siderophore-interacting protein [Novosphingobium sp. Fuku2-ISO-50]|uniref:siderophore-interacting protein n=1 Tax=Novosphingobium sp. Fuku2-ISO-50 TaxID=1739114 RepID=UPI000A852E9C|nr:siderophore-interacting protein [Novosphingobium sp. Fuku2-ISO-50]
MPHNPISRHQIARLRHDTRRRTLTVATIEALGTRMRRIGFTSPELHDFVSASPDDHIKLFFEDAGGQSVMRDFTPRRFDTGAGTLTIDFALHDTGPATQWAAAAQVGDRLAIGGPRGSTVVPDDFDWYLLIGDESALPAIGRRVEELRAGAPVITLGLVNGAADEQVFATRAAWSGHWVHRNGAEDAADGAAALLGALKALALPAGEGFVWIAAETGVAKALRAHVQGTLGHPREWLKASGYWTKGLADAADKSLDG